MSLIPQPLPRPWGLAEPHFPAFSSCWIPSWPFCSGGSAEAEPSSCRHGEINPWEQRNHSRTMRGAVPPKIHHCPGVRPGELCPRLGTHPRAPRGSSCTQGSRRDPQRCRGAQLCPGTSPDLPGIQSPLLSCAAARARCEISPLEMLAARIYGFCSFPFMAPAGEGLARDERCCCSGRDGREHFKGSRDTESRWDTGDPSIAAIHSSQQPLPPQARPENHLKPESSTCSSALEQELPSGAPSRFLITP